MYTYSQLEEIAQVGAYTISGRDIGRITVAQVHELYSALAKSERDEADTAILAMGKLRRWLVDGGSEPPPVRGAGFVRSNREVWVAYTTCKAPVLVGGRASALAELSRYLPVVASPGYDGSLRVRTSPPLHLLPGSDVVLRFPQRSVTLGSQAVQRLEQWLSHTMRPKDRRGVLCLPCKWTSD